MKFELTDKNIGVIFWVICIVLFMACVVISAYTYFSIKTESSALITTINVAFASLGAAGVILTTFFNAINTFKQRLSNKIENTFALVTKWDDPHLLEARRFTRKIKAKADNLSKRELIERIEEDESLKQSVLLVLNYLEHVRFSIVSDRIDNYLFYKSLGSTLTDIIDRFLPYAEYVGKLLLKDLNSLKNNLEQINLKIEKNKK